MGGGTSIGIHVNGMVVDVNNALDGDGPFAIERAGTVPAGDWMRWVLSHQHDPQALQLMLTGRGGLVAYLGTNDFPAIEQSADGVGATLDQDALRRAHQHTCATRSSKSIAGLAAFTNGQRGRGRPHRGAGVFSAGREGDHRAGVVPRSRARFSRGERAGGPGHGRTRSSPSERLPRASTRDEGSRMSTRDNWPGASRWSTDGSSTA